MSQHPHHWPLRTRLALLAGLAPAGSPGEQYGYREVYFNHAGALARLGPLFTRAH